MKGVEETPRYTVEEMKRLEEKRQIADRIALRRYEEIDQQIRQKDIVQYRLIAQDKEPTSRAFSGSHFYYHASMENRQAFIDSIKRDFDRGDI